jgi:hypothetical protein
MSFSEDVPPRSAGKRSLLMTHTGGQGTGAQLYRRLLPGHDRLFARLYVKFDQDCAPLHHFGSGLGGYNPSTPWPQGGAGERPAGDKRFLVDIEPFGASWRWDYYVYWCEMRGSPPRGQTWGNSFIRDPKLEVARGRWICVETMIQMNDMGESNGELALWIDGKRVSHLGKGFPKGKWVFDKFTPGEGGEGVRWNDATGDREVFSVPPGGEPEEVDEYLKDRAAKGFTVIQAYENHPTGANQPRIDAHKVRTQAYAAMLAGAAGHGYGALDLFYFYGDADGPFPKNGFQHWRVALAYEGSRQVGLMRRLFEERPWHKLVPDQSAIASDQGEGAQRLIAARAGDGSFVIAYTPLGRPLSTRMDKVTGAKVAARWYDPRDGSWSDIGEFANTGAREFTAPSQGPASDWVLVLDARQ